MRITFPTEWVDGPGRTRQRLPGCQGSKAGRAYQMDAQAVLNVSKTSSHLVDFLRASEQARERLCACGEVQMERQGQRN